MTGVLLLAAAAMAHLPAAVAINEEPERVDVAYTELADGRTDEAIARIEGNGSLKANDPARLINLGTAYARVGRMNEARQMFRAALLAGENVDLELADGRWIDSRSAARAALANLDNRTALAMR